MTQIVSFRAHSLLGDGRAITYCMHESTILCCQGNSGFLSHKLTDMSIYAIEE